MEPIPLVIDTWLQYVIFASAGGVFLAAAFTGAGRIDRRKRWGWFIILGGLLAAVAVYVFTYPVLSRPQDARAAAIAETYGVELDHVQLNDIGYSAQTEIDTDAGPYVLGTLLVDHSDGTVDVLRLAWDGEQLVLTDGDNVELPRR